MTTMFLLAMVVAASIVFLGAGQAYDAATSGSESRRRYGITMATSLVVLAAALITLLAIEEAKP